ncbi:MAG: sorbitol-6-phosphate dehydrogenase [Verrucomicrobia bacterium]|nr:sorbitol-6-phosphate dehydrogenase [Verrucomicrobiota bacterium]
MAERFADKAVIVTGAAQGLGRALAEAFLREGAAVVLADIDAIKLDETVHELHDMAPTRVIPVQTDVTSERSVQRMVQATLDLHKRLDVLVCNAGILKAGAVTEFDAADWRAVVEVNLVGYFLCVKHAARVMKERGGGAIVQINSKSGRVGSFRNSAYAASKFGGIGLTQSLALELAPHHVRVNAVCPGNLLDSPLWVDSLYEQYAAKWGVSKEEVRARYIEKVPLGRGGEYGDVTAAVLFLAGDEAGYVTGQALNVDGGQVMS